MTGLSAGFVVSVTSEMAEMTFSEVYPALTKLNISSHSLLSYSSTAHAAADHDVLDLTVDSRDCITNEVVLELCHFMNRNPVCTYYTLWRWLFALYAKSLNHQPQDHSHEFPTIKAVRQSLVRLVAKLSKLKKLPQGIKKTEQISAFLSEEYSLPSVFLSKSGQLVQLPQYLSSSTSACSSCSETEKLKSVNIQLCHELSVVSDEVNSLKGNEEKLLETRQKLYAANRNNTKKLKRREKAIQKKKKEVVNGKKVIKDLQYKVTQNQTEVLSLKSKIDRLRHRAMYWKSRYIQLSEASSEENDLDTESGKQLHLYRQEIAELENENSDLREKIQEVMSGTTSDLISTFDKGKYTDDVRACCYELLSLNVSVRNVKSVIESVLTNIAHKQVERLPQKSILCNMMLECLSVAQVQLGEALSQDDGAFYTLQTDGTTKHGKHFGTYDIATEDVTYRLGLRHIFSGTAQTTLETLTEILDDLNVVQSKVGSSDVSSKIISKVKNTMSDRHAAEKLFSEILAEYRADILPEIVTGWASLSNEEKDEMVRMNNFFCSLHFLVGLATTADETLKVWESTVQGNNATVDGRSSGTQRLIRTACKAFHHRGSEQAGCSTYFRAYLRRKGISKIPLASFVGNRFNILFYDAAGVFYLREHMSDYLRKAHGSRLNQLLQAVLSDLETDHLVTGCRALGIIDKLITGPFWRYLQLSNVSILEMSDLYSTMITKFEEWSNDARVVIKDQPMVYEGWSLSRDDSFELLFESDDAEENVALLELLQLLFKSFAITIQRLVADHLPGGEFHGVTNPEIVKETLSVPKTNISPERDFAILDRLMAQKPNATHIALEALILFSQNKTIDWLRLKSSAERERLLQAARNLVPVHRANFQKRREEMEKLRQREIEKRERALRLKKDKELKEKEELTLKIQQYGLWTSTRDVTEGLREIKSKKAKLDALKSQITFRRKVLDQTCAEKEVFQFSSNHQAFSIEKLTENLLKLFPTSGETSNAPISDLSSETLRKDPELLIYRRIKHLFDCDDNEVWYEGTVLGYNDETEEYTIAYDKEDSVYEFNLLEDLDCGDLIVL